MPNVETVKMYKDGSFELVEKDRVQRFLATGWTMEESIVVKPVAGKKSQKRGSKNKVTVDAHVTSKEEVNEEWDPLTGEDWADSIESVSVPEDEPTISDFETAKKED